MPKRVLAIYSATESARHPFAASSEALEEACAHLQGTELALERLGLQLVAAADEEAIGHLSPRALEAFDALVLCTNALYSDAVAREVRHRSEDLRRFVQCGGGLLVLPQPPACFGSELQALLGVDFETRSVGVTSQALPVAAHDVLLNFPWKARTTDLADRRQSDGPVRLTEHCLAPLGTSTSSTTVLELGGDAVLARANTETQPGHRWVVSAIPLDWRRDTELLGNCLCWTVFGAPTSLVLGGNGPQLESIVRRGLAGRLAAHALDLECLGHGGRWALNSVNNVIVTDPKLGTEKGDFEAFLASGGRLVVLEASSAPGVSSISLTVGSRGARDSARRFLRHLATEPRWGEAVAGGVFETRDLVAAVLTAAKLEPELARFVLSNSKREALIRYCWLRADAACKELNVVAFVARGETLRLLGSAPPQPTAAIIRDVARYGPSTAALCAAVADGAPVTEIAEIPEPAGISDLARWASTIASLQRLGLVGLDLKHRRSLAREFVTIALAHERPGGGWLSFWTTADIGSAALGMLGDGPEELRVVVERAADHLAQGVRGGPASGLHRFARYAELDVLIEQRLPEPLSILGENEDRTAAAGFAGEVERLAQQSEDHRLLLDESARFLAAGRATLNACLVAGLLLPLMAFSLAVSALELSDVFAAAAALVVPYGAFCAVTIRVWKRRRLASGRLARLLELLPGDLK